MKWYVTAKCNNFFFGDKQPLILYLNKKKNRIIIDQWSVINVIEWEKKTILKLKTYGWWIGIFQFFLYIANILGLSSSSSSYCYLFAVFIFQFIDFWIMFSGWRFFFLRKKKNCLFFLLLILSWFCFGIVYIVLAVYGHCLRLNF